MFSPSEYLTNLKQITLLNGLVTPPGQLPSIPQIPKMVPSAGIPVIATVPPTTGECHDIISAVASSPLALGLAATLAAALLLNYLIRKHGKALLGWFRTNAKQLVASIKAKLWKQRSIALLPASQTLVMG